jgi:SAM-dependent methyltransferase
MNCRHCGEELRITFADLECCPPSNAYLTNNKLYGAEKWYPLTVLVCEKCWLVQTHDFVDAREMFTEDYAYLSSYSVSWLEHARNYVDMAVERFGLGQKSLVTEVAANDGYLLQYVRDKQIPCFGIEPTHVAAEAAREKGIDILEDFFGVRLAEELKRNGRQADLMVGNNVLAHVPDINDFVKGFTILLKPDGVVTFEFPHLLNLIKYTLFDTIYHEHFSYLSLHAVRSVFRSNGLSLFDVEEVKTHGGSYRVYGQRADTGIHPVSENVERFLQAEKEAGLLDKQVYLDFSSKLQHIKNDLLSFLIEQNNRHMKVAAYGAAAKGNTLMNFAGVRKDYVSYVVDKNPTKSGKYMPGNHIPIVDENLLLRDKPDYILILPWNLKDEIIQQLDYTRSWGCRFVSAIPELNVLA